MARRTNTDFAASGAQTASGSGPAVFLHDSAEYLSVLIAVTAVSGTTPSATFSVQWSNDGINWANGDAADTFTAITAVGNVAKSFPVKGMHARLSWAITGTTPSFTFAATGVTTGSRSY